MGGARDPEVEAGIVDWNDEVDLVEVGAHPLLEPTEEPQMAYDLGEPHDRELIEPGEELHALGLHQGSPRSPEAHAG